MRQQLSLGLQVVRQNHLLRSHALVGVVLTALGGMSVLLGLLIGKGRMLPAAALVALVALALICMAVSSSFRLFVLLLPVTALAVPFEVSSGTGSMLPVALLLAILLTGIWALSLYVRGWQLAPSPLNRPLLTFCAVMVVAFVWGRLWRDPGLIDWNNRFVVVQIASLVTNLVSVSAALLIGNFVVTVRQLKFVVGVFIVCGMLMVLAQTFNIPQSILTMRGLWSLWLVAPLYSLLIAQPGLKLRWRALIVLMLLLTFYEVMVVDSLWLSGWVPALAAIFPITLMRSWRLFLVLALVAAIGGYLGQGFFQKTADDNVAEGGLQRITMWEQNFRIINDHWLLGTGPAGYASYYRTYYFYSARSTHNNIFDIVAQFGVVGMGVWVWLVVVSLWEGWSLALRAPPGFVRTLAYAVTGGWVAANASMMLGDWLLPFAYNQTITGYKWTVFSWIFLGMLISMRRILDRPAHPGPVAEAEVS
jgi:O-antigen ligase